MSHRPVIVVSDVHLGAVPEATERLFRDFLRTLRQEASYVLINGDLFDFWFEYRTVIHARHYRVLAELAELAESGVRIGFVGGNHDAWGGEFLQRQVGMEIVPEGSILEFAGRRALVVHGDGVGSGDLGYRILKRCLRHPLLVHGFRALHPDLGSRLAARVSRTEAKQGNAVGASLHRARALEAWAAAELERDPALDLVLAGHTHLPTVTEVRPGRFYINTGDWINHFTYLTLAEGAPPELRTWTPL